MARSFVGWDGGLLGLLVDGSSRDRNHWAWSHVIQSLCGKTSDWSDCSRIRDREMMLIRGFWLL